MDTQKDCNYIVLFASERSLTFKGLYRLEYEADGQSFMAAKMYGAGPNTLDSTQVFKYYKYNSAAKTFDLMTTKTFGLTVDGMALPPIKTSRPPSAKRDRAVR